MTLIQKKEFVKSVKYFAATDISWLLLSHEHPNGHETRWTKRVVASALKRHGKI